MLGAVAPFQGLQRTPAECLGVTKSSLGQKNSGQVVQESRHLRMLRSQDLLLNGERLSKGRLRFVELSLAPVQRAERVVGVGAVRVVGAEDLLAYGECSNVLDGCLVVPP